MVKWTLSETVYFDETVDFAHKEIIISCHITRYSIKSLVTDMS